MKQGDKEKNFVSCVLYLHNDEETVIEFLQGICSVMRQKFAPIWNNLSI